MSMAWSQLFSPKFIPISSAVPAKHLVTHHHCVPCRCIRYYNGKREFPLPKVASIPYQPIDMEGEFSGHGVTFEGIGDSCVAKMGLENGSTATLMLPSGLITSYKAPMWHGGSVELLHTSVFEEENGDAVIRGGVSVALNCCGDGEQVPWSPTNWALLNISGNAQESIQVELINSDSENLFEVKYIVSLQEDILSSEIVVSNSKFSTLQLKGSIVSHLTVSSPDATYAVGLQGSNFVNRPPFLSSFGIVPPDLRQKNEFGFGQLWDQKSLKGLLSGRSPRNQNTADAAGGIQREREDEVEGEEEGNYMHLTEQLSRIFTSAPRRFTVIDRGRRSSVVIGRDGFDELYMCSPGSSHEYYGTYSYVCVGQSALLKPIILGPQEEWRGCQHLHNPNL